jgi:hypothetical protein
MIDQLHGKDKLGLIKTQIGYVMRNMRNKSSGAGAQINFFKTQLKNDNDDEWRHIAFHPVTNDL